jgi:hypothetical protein
MELGVVRQNGGKETRFYKIRPLPRLVDTTVTVRFKAQGKGGPGDRIVDTLCESQITIPATRAPVVNVTCLNGIHIDYVNGAYSPNPFLWTASVRNTGTATAFDVRASLSLPPHFVLDTLEKEDKAIGELNIGDSRTVSWRIRAEQLPRPDTGVICVRTYDRFHRTSVCCDTVVLPSTRIPELKASCLVIPDSVFVDLGTGEYQPSEITAIVFVSNIGTEFVDSVRAEIIVSDPGIALVSPTSRTVMLRQRLEPNGFVQATWTLRPLLRSFPRDVMILFRISGSGVGEVTTNCAVHIGASLQAALSCTTSTIPADTLHFNSSTLEYDTITVTAEVANTGSVSAPNVQATILLPPLIGLVSGEHPVKQLAPGPLLVNGRWVVSWRIHPMKRRDGKLDTIRVEFQSGDKRSLCEDRIFIIGIPPVTVLSIPVNNVNMYGHSLRIPVQIDNTDNKTINNLRVAVHYDTTKVEFNGFDPAPGLLTTWDITSQSVPGTIVFFARSDTAVLHGEGVLVHMNFDVRFGLGDDILRVSGTDLRFDTLFSSVNEGSILARYLNGYIYVSGDCLPPLNATERYVLVTSNPNPTESLSLLTIHLEHAGYLSMRVVDYIGRTVQQTADRLVPQGNNSLPFDGTFLPKGRYFCLVSLDGNLIGSTSLLLR